MNSLPLRCLLGRPGRPGRQDSWLDALAGKSSGAGTAGDIAVWPQGRRCAWLLEEQRTETVAGEEKAWSGKEAALVGVPLL